jgi:hypothetical protein
MARLHRLFACLLALSAAVAGGPRALAQQKGEKGEKSAPAKTAAASESESKAQDVDEKALASYSPYEKTTIRAALAKLETSIDPSPQGKVIEAVEIVPLEVIEERDPAPAFLNWFHSTTKPYVIRREVLLLKGDRFRQDLCDESARNLSGIRQISLVVCVPARGSRPDRVRLVMITKDVWSLRINTNFRYAGGKFEYLLVQPAEENLFGSHQAIHATFLLDLATVAIGGRYKMPRIGGSFLELAAEANVIVNLDTGEPEGSAGLFSYGQPLTSTLTEWSWGAVVGWRNEILRRFCVTGTTACAGNLRGFDAKVTPDVDDAIPFSYRSDVQSGQYFATRSYGREIKHNFSAGLDVSRRVFRTGDLSGFDPAAVEEFEDRVLPVSDTRIGPFLEYRTVSRSRRLSGGATR